MVLRFQNCGISKHHTNDGKYTPIVNFFVPSYSYFKKFGTSESFREHWPTEDMARHNDKYLKTFIGRLKAIVGVKFQVHNQEYDNIIKAEKANGIGDNQQPRGESQPKRKSLRNSAIPEDDIASEQDNESEAEDEGETLFIVKQRTQNEDSNTRRKAKTPKGKQHARPQTADAGKTASPSTATSSENTLPASNSKSRRGRKSIQDLDDDELLDSGRETNSDDDYNPGPSKGTAEIGKQTSVPKNTRSTRKRA